MGIWAIHWSSTLGGSEKEKTRGVVGRTILPLREMNGGSSTMQTIDFSGPHNQTVLSNYRLYKYNYSSWPVAAR